MRLILAIAISGLVLVVLVFPATILGIHRDQLSLSTGATSIAKCREESGQWTCPVWSNDISGTVNYDVDVSFIGCWDANRGGRENADFPPPHISGCVTGLDYLASLVF